MPEALDIIDRILSESPQSIAAASFGMDDPVPQAKLVSKLDSHPMHKVGEFADLDLVKAGQYIFAKDALGLAYFVRIAEDKYSVLPGKHATQIAVWRRGDAPAGLAKHVFWSHVFPLHELVVTDGMQTPEGRRFWTARTAEAFESGLNVYGLNVRTRKIVQFGSRKQIHDDLGLLYGDSAEAQDLRIAITSEWLTDPPENNYGV